jgi:acyl carrier protein
VSTNPAAPGRVVREEDLRSRIRDFIFTTFYVADPGTLKDDTSLLEAGLVDSTGVLEVIQFLESSFGLHVQDDEIVPENLDSVEHLVAYVSRKAADGREVW